MAWSCALSQQLFDVLRDDVDLEVDGRTRGGRPERGHGEGRRDETDGERGPVDLDDGEGHPVDGDGALRDDVPGQVCRQGDPHDLPLLTGGALEHGAGAVDMALHEVPPEPGLQGDG